MDKPKTTFTRFDSAESPRGPRSLDQLTDEDIKSADSLVLVDSTHPEWQEMLWGVAIGDGMGTSLTLQIVEIGVDSQDESQIEAARQRISRIKSGKKPR